MRRASGGENAARRQPHLPSHWFPQQKATAELRVKLTRVRGRSECWVQVSYGGVVKYFPGCLGVIDMMDWILRGGGEDHAE